MDFKTSGYNLKKFLDDDEIWPETGYCDDMTFLVNGKEVEDCAEINDSDVVVVTGGMVKSEIENEDICMLSTLYKKWKRTQTHETILVNIPKTNRKTFDELLKSLGARTILS